MTMKQVWMEGRGIKIEILLSLSLFAFLNFITYLAEDGYVSKIVRQLELALSFVVPSASNSQLGPVHPPEQMQLHPIVLNLPPFTHRILFGHSLTQLQVFWLKEWPGKQGNGSGTMHWRHCSPSQKVMPFTPEDIALRNASAVTGGLVWAAFSSREIKDAPKNTEVRKLSVLSVLSRCIHLGNSLT